jgi:hypothetical protein
MGCLEYRLLRTTLYLPLSSARMTFYVVSDFCVVSTVPAEIVVRRRSSQRRQN